MAKWYILYNLTTGRAISQTSVPILDIPGGTGVLEFDNKPDDTTLMWDESSRNFVTRPPKVLVDRLDDILSNPAYSDFLAVWNALNASRRTQIRNALVRLLGNRRYRNQNESVEL